MPIRLNLLAEQIADEELRRRDPVKRTGWVCGLLVVGVFAWSGYLQLKIMNAQGVLTGFQNDWKANEKKYKAVTENKKQIREHEDKLELLTKLATNRFLIGPLLNQLQHAGVEDIQVRQLLSETRFTEEPPVKGRTNEAGKVTPAKPATSTEIVTFTIEGRDYGNPPGDQSFRFRQRIATLFKDRITNDSSIALRGGLSAVQSDSGGDASRSFVAFKLVCDFPPKTR